MKNLNIFQVVLLCVFGLAIIIGVLIFGGYLPGFRHQSGGSAGTIVMWGTLPMDEKLTKFFIDFNKKNESLFTVDYVPKNKNSFESELVEALAAGQGPDLVILPQDLLYKQSNKILPLPYTMIKARDFQDTYFNGADILMRSDGVVALPLWVDPLVMYYNKDLLASAGLASVPTNWSAFILAQKSLTKKDNAGNIRQAGVAMGEASNIANFKDILATLSMQAGDPIVTSNEKGYSVVFGQGGSENVMSPAKATVSFFTQFSDPGKATYSWNRSLPEAEEAFYGGNLALYFGFGSEMSDIMEKNPHLYFDLASLPQRDIGVGKVTFGRIYGMSIINSSKKASYAAQVAMALTAADSDKILADIAGAAPARRDLLASGISDPKMSVIYQNALISRAWTDPNPEKSREVFKDMISSVTVGGVDLESSVGTAALELQNLFKN